MTFDKEIIRTWSTEKKMEIMGIKAEGMAAAVKGAGEALAYALTNRAGYGFCTQLTTEYVANDVAEDMAEIAKTIDSNADEYDKAQALAEAAEYALEAVYRVSEAFKAISDFV